MYRVTCFGLGDAPYCTAKNIATVLMNIIFSEIWISSGHVYRWGEVEWGHTISRARLCSDVAAAVLLVNEVNSVSSEPAQAMFE